MDWGASAKLLERKDGGSDLYYEFDEQRSGPLGALIADVITLPSEKSARLVIDAGAQGTFNIGEIRALSKRDDFSG